MKRPPGYRGLATLKAEEGSAGGSMRRRARGRGPCGPHLRPGLAGQQVAQLARQAPKVSRQAPEQPLGHGPAGGAMPRRPKVAIRE